MRIDPSLAPPEPHIPPMARAFVADAERRIAAGDHEGVVKLAGTLRTAFHRAIESPSDTENNALPWVNLFDGESRLVLGDADGAVKSLAAAVDGGDGELRARASWALGRALYAAGRRTAAESALMHGQQGYVPPPAEHIDGLRILADLSMSAGDLDRAEDWLQRALQVAVDANDAEGVAVANRGLARCAILKGPCADALDPIRAALRALEEDARPDAMAPVLLDAVEVQTILGRYSSALEYAGAAQGWTRGLPLQSAMAHALRAEVEVLLGVPDAAARSVEVARGWIAEHMPRSPDLVLGTARVLCALGQHTHALGLLDELIEPEPSEATDPTGQTIAVRARALAPADPEAAAGLASAALARKLPLSPVAAARIRLDAARALIDAGNAPAGRSAAKKGVKALQRTGNRGLKLELLMVIAELGAEANNVVTIRRAAEAIIADLPPAARDDLLPAPHRRRLARGVGAGRISPSYAIFVALAFVLAALVRRIEVRRLGYDRDPRHASVDLGGMVGAVIGAKAGLVLFARPSEAWAADLLSLDFTGKTVIGGIAGGYLGVEAIKAWRGIRWSTGDGFAVALPVGQAVGRLGCLFHGCCYGTPFEGPWAAHVAGALRHPTPAYELILDLVLAALLWRVRRRTSPAGGCFAPTSWATRSSGSRWTPSAAMGRGGSARCRRCSGSASPSWWGSGSRRGERDRRR